MLKKIISILACAALAFGGSVVPASAGSYNLVDLDFEDMTFDDFSSLGNITFNNGVAGDIMNIEEESPGNTAFKLFRKNANVKDSETKLGFTYKLPQTLTSGKVNVSFKIKSENTYRSRWSDLGSTLTSSGGNKVFLFTHSSWVWGMATGGQYWYTDISKSNTWITVNYEIDIPNNKYTAWVEKDGTATSKTTKDCGSGDVSAIKFEIGKRNVSWTSSNDESGEDLFYWIDDIKVSVNRLAVASSSITDGMEDVPLDMPVIFDFDAPVGGESVNNSNFVIESNGEAVPAEISQVSPSTISVAPQDGFLYNTDYKITVKKDVLSEEKESMAEDYVISFKTVSLIKTDLEEGARYTMGYKPQIEILPGTDYNMEISRDGGEYTAYNGEAFDETGKYSLRFEGEDAQGRRQEEEISFEVIGAVAPVAQEVVISGEPVIGNVLKGDYKYFDENGDEQGESTYKWYRSSEIDGAYKEIEGANAKEYVISDADEDSYIKFGVTPVSSKEPYTGEEVLSDAFTGPMNPSVDKITVSGTVAENSELEVSYEYYDENSDEEITEGENASVITWYSSDKKDGTFEKIGTGKKYTLTSEENERWLKVGIIPKNAGSGKQDKEFFSEVFAGASAPVAEDVKIVGNLKAGSVVGVDYKYIDNNSDPQGQTKFEWYVGGKLKSTKESLTIESSDKGEKIYVVVTTVSTVEPCVGKPVSSSVGTISSGSSGSVSSGGRNTGSSSGPAIVPINPNVENNQEEPEDEDKTVFSDIEQHWAKNEIISMTEKGIIKGKSEKLFAPDDNITRAEFAAIITRAFNLPSGECNFEDVSAGDWFFEEVGAVANAGYMNGSDGNFRPYTQITRQEIAVVLANIARDKGMNDLNAVPEFKDESDIADWAKSSVEYVTALGLLKGIDSDYFAPKSEATRAQAVVVLSRIIEQ